jgi:hypothetical protein
VYECVCVCVFLNIFVCVFVLGCVGLDGFFSQFNPLKLSPTSLLLIYLYFWHVRPEL